MVFPRQEITKVDPGLPKATTANVALLLLGAAESGSTSQIETLTRPGDAKDTYEAGPLAREAAHILRYGGRPLRALRLPEAVAPAAGAVTHEDGSGGAGAGPTLTVDDSGLNGRYGVRVEVVTGGALGTAQVKYSLDFWAGGSDAGGVAETFADTITVPGTGIIAFDGTGMTATFAATPDLVAGETYDFETTDAVHDAAGVTGASSIIQAYGLPFDLIVLAGSQATAALANSDASALDGVIDDLVAIMKHRGGYLHASRDTDANVLAGDLVTTFESIQLGALYGEAQVTASLPLPGMSSVRVPGHAPLAARISANLISTDPIRLASRALPGVLAITHDEYVERSLDDAKIATLRTWPTETGHFITNAWIKSAANSDFRYTQHLVIANRFCEAVIRGQSRYIGASLRTNPDGTLLEEDAVAIEEDLRAQLNALFLGPRNAEGTKGHASALAYDIDRTVSLLATEEVVADVGIQPLGYPRLFRTRIGFRAVAT